MGKGGARIGAGRPRGQGPHGEATKPVRIPVSMIAEVVEYIAHRGYQVPMYGTKVQAGFPSPADDFMEGKLDLNLCWALAFTKAIFLLWIAVWNPWMGKL